MHQDFDDLLSSFLKSEVVEQLLSLKSYSTVLYCRYVEIGGRW
jgi:hypothetical protein